MRLDEKIEENNFIAMKYKLSNETIKIGTRTLYRIECVESFSDVTAGEKGGYIEKTDNLSQHGDAWVYGNADYIVFKNNWTSGRYFTWTRSNDKWKVGCFYGTGKELIQKAYKDSECSGKHYEAYVRFVEQLKQIDV